MKTIVQYMAAIIITAGCGHEAGPIPLAPPAGGAGGAAAARTFRLVLSSDYSEGETLVADRAAFPDYEIWHDRKDGTYVVFSGAGAFLQAADGGRTAIASWPIDLGYDLVTVQGGAVTFESKVFPPGWDTTPPYTHPTVASIAWCGGQYQAVCP